MSRVLNVLRSYARNPAHVPRNLSWRLPRTTSASGAVFVVGAPRSGTSLVQSVLAAHSELFSIPGETGLFSLQNIFGRRHFGLSWAENRSLFAESRDLVDFFDRAVGLLESRSPGATFVEKTPQHVLRLPFLTRRFPNARFVNVVRDGRDCFASAKGHPGIPQSSSARRFARYWRRCVDSALEMSGHPRILTLRYEDFARSAPEELDRVMRFLGFEPEPGQLDPAAFGSHKRGRRNEFHLLRSAVSDARVGRFRAELSPAERRAFERVAARQLAAHGYRLEDRGPD